MIEVSIIMPLYNAEKYLRESLESISSQIFMEYEVICIDDGSSDSTMEILHEFAQKDNRTKIFENRQHSGAAHSRNRGLHEARGEYVIFLDGDDIFDEVMLERAVHTMKKYDSDVVLFDFIHVLSENIYEKKSICHGERYKQKYCTRTFAIKDIASYESLLWSPATCNKMYRKDFVLRNKLEFQNIQNSNDVYFSYMALLLSDKTIVMDDERVMVYARDHAEPSRISNNRNPFCVFAAMEKLQQELINRDRFKDLFSHFYYMAYFLLKSSLFMCRDTEQEKELYKFLQNKGINILCGNGMPYFNQTDEFIKQRMTFFQTESYQTRWYEADNLLDFYLRDNKTMVCELFRRFVKDNKKICIWGAGRNGWSLVNFLRENHIKVDLIVDKDVRKQGGRLGEYLISNPEEVQKGIDVIIFSGVGIADIVKAELGSTKNRFMYIDINVLLGVV